jgi:hypothetical protein
MTEITILVKDTMIHIICMMSHFIFEMIWIKDQILEKSKIVIVLLT